MSARDYPDITSIGSSRPASPIFGPGGFAPSRSGEAPSRQAWQHRPDDSTGLSISQEELREKVAAFAREQEASVHEQAYKAAGRLAGRSAAHTSFAQSGGEIAGNAAQATSQMAGQTPTEQPPLTASEKTPEREESQDPVAAGATEERSAERTFMAGAALVQAPTEQQPQGKAKRAGNEPQEDDPNAQDEGQEENADSDDGMNAELSEEEQQEVQELKERDREVRTHEQAHISAGGSIVAGGASYDTETGPDGKSYAVGGEVQIDTSKGSSPEDTVAKARKVKQAALAPAEPSGQDRKVAAKASQMESEARQEMSETKREQGAGETGDTAAASSEPDTPASRATGNTAPGEPETDNSSAQGVAGMERLSAHALQSYRKTSGAELPAPLGVARSFAV